MKEIEQHCSRSSVFEEDGPCSEHKFRMTGQHKMLWVFK